MGRTLNKRGALLLALVAALGVAGCIERTITITSDPPGALVYLNDEEVGRTPVTVPFLFYGVYDVRLEHAGYQALWTKHAAEAPWWEAPGPDLLAETKPNNQVQLNWHFTLEPQPPENVDALVARAKQLGATLEPPAPATQPATQPATEPGM